MDDIRYIKRDTPPRRARRGYGRVIGGFVLIAVVVFGIFVVLSSRSAGAQSVVIPEGLTRSDIAAKIGESFKWSEADMKEFAATYATMQWMAFNKELPEVFEEKFKWGTAAEEVFLTSSSRYSEPQYDFLSTVYAPGNYIFGSKDSFARVADALIKPVAATSSFQSFLAVHIEQKAAENVVRLVRSSFENMPDLVPLPPQDLTLDKNEFGDQLLRFTTIFYNRGKGPLELRADPATAGIRSDIERTVFQRIYRNDGATRQRPAGTFLWHQEHLHYHFADFAVYDLEAIETKTPPPDLSGVPQKSTFCIRDVSLTDLELLNKAADAAYKICGKELQGISVGWADTYFFTYPDQLLNIEDLPSGTYRLKFIINPSDRFDESDMSNNISSSLIKLDVEGHTVEVVGEEPKEYPTVEHVYPEQDCPACTG